MPVTISGAVEGVVDEAAFRALVKLVGADPGTVYGKRGKQYLISRLAGYNSAAVRSPWLVILDLDSSADCAPVWVASLPQAGPFMCLRVAMRAVESWALADVESVCDWTGLSRKVVAVEVESLANPKRHLIGLVQKSRRRSLASDILPRPGSGRTEGPGYAGQLIEFFSARWDVRRAATNCPSLSRAVACLEALVAKS